MLSVKTDDNNLVFVSRDDYASFYDCSPAIDPRLLKGGAFMAPGHTTSLL